MKSGRKLCRNFPIRTAALGLFTLGGVLIAAYPARATDFTLSDTAIMSLDYNESQDYFPTPTATVTSKQDIPGTGVEYKLHFLSPTNNYDYFIYQVSQRYHGAGTLAGMNVGSYSNFDLEFTVVSIDGLHNGNGVLLVGSVIGLNSNGTKEHYWPVEIGLNGLAPTSAISSSVVSAASTYVIGYTAMLAFDWSPGPHDVTLLVQPAPGAEQIPEPAAWAMVTVGTAALFGHRRLRHSSSRYLVEVQTLGFAKRPRRGANFSCLLVAAALARLRRGSVAAPRHQAYPDAAESQRHVPISP